MLLNNGRRVRSNSVPDLAGDSQPFGEEEGGTSDLDALLYRADIPVGSRGDIIQFYNKVFISYIKDFVTRFSPVEDVSYYVHDACLACMLIVSVLR